MIIGWPEIITTFTAWALNKGVPAVWHSHTEKTHVGLMKDYCPTLQQLGPNPSELILNQRNQDCKPLFDYMEGKTNDSSH